MGDHRANIKVEFAVHGKTYKSEWNINYWPEDDSGIDRRISEWFLECWEDAYSRYQKSVVDSEHEQNKSRIEAEERAQLAKLLDKYPESSRIKEGR